MIKSDNITITKATNPKLVVGVNSGELYLSDKSHSFKYSDFYDRFLGQGENQPGGESRNLATVKQQDVGVGEEWELVA